MLDIKNNMMAENAARHLGQSYDALSQSVERLSSGLRINSAADDAAGMAVSEMCRSTVAQPNKARVTRKDAISMLQTAEGALGSDDDILVRMNELAEQASTGSYSSAQRTIMNNEFQQLAQEITRVGDSTEFNGISMLNNTNTVSFNVGSADTIDVTAQDMTAAGMNLGSTGSADAITFGTGTANPNLTGFVTGKAGGGAINIQFGAENAIDVTFAAGQTYSLAQTVQLINTASQAASGYNAASEVYDAGTNQYSLKVSAQTNGANAASLTGTTQTGMTTLATNWTEAVGASGQRG